MNFFCSHANAFNFSKMSINYQKFAHKLYLVNKGGWYLAIIYIKSRDSPAKDKTQCRAVVQRPDAPARNATHRKIKRDVYSMHLCNVVCVVCVILTRIVRLVQFFHWALRVLGGNSSFIPKALHFFNNHTWKIFKHHMQLTHVKKIAPVTYLDWKEVYL